MSGDTFSSPATVRRRALWITSAAAALIAIGTAVAIAVAVPSDAGSSSADPSAGSPTSATPASPTPTVTATPAPAGPATAVGTIDDDEALATIETALAAPISTAGTSADLDALLKDVAVDAYAEELEAQWQELASQGWSITGTPVLVSSSVTSLTADTDPPTAQVTACIDSSAVEMLDAAGAPIGDDSAKTPRALHLFTLVQGSDDIWRIAAHSFPNDPTC
ncbi:hypothetical protein ACI3KS_15670 [Microbacterium sp. ZW T5_45]|uniref:hypothetical protein n=1 Tax=Microbacterium sp. ZW T5_45 TaxID=3378080 RepID=UPI00385276E3